MKGLKINERMAKTKTSEADNKCKKNILKFKAAERFQKKKRKVEAFLSLISKEEIPVKKIKPNTEEELAKSPVDVVKLKKRLTLALAKKRKWKKLQMKKPKLFLTLENLDPECPTETLIQMMDLRNLLLSCLVKHSDRYFVRWCKFLRPMYLKGICLVVLDGVGADDYLQHKEQFSNLNTLFNMSIDLLPPETYGQSFFNDMFKVPMSKRSFKEFKKSADLATVEKDSKIEKDYNIDDSGKTLNGNSRTNLENDSKANDAGNISTLDVFDRTRLLMSGEQMFLEGYTLPGQNLEYKDYVYTCDQYEPVTSNSPLFAVDCEMCVTSIHENELTRVSIVNENLECIFDSYVKPDNIIINYITRYSGITKKILNPVTTRLCDVQQIFRQMIPSNAILCGQSLNQDLKALKMFHPYVIDTSCIYNMTGVRSNKSGLKRLAAHFLSETIQGGKNGHSPVEDATVTMKLVKLKLKQGYTFGDVVQQNKTFIDSLKKKLLTTSLTASSAKQHLIVKEDADIISNQETAVDSPQMTLKKESNTTRAVSTRSVRNESLVRFVTHFAKCKQTGARKNKNYMKTFYTNGSFYYEDFFQIIDMNYKKANVIRRDGLSTLTHESKHVTSMTCTSNEDAVNLVAKSTKCFDVTFAQLDGFRRLVDEKLGLTDKSEVLRKLDALVGEIHCQLPEDMLFMVALSGRNDTQAMCFLKLTTAQVS